MAEEVPEFIKKFYSGIPCAEHGADAFQAGVAADATVEFIGPHRPIGPDGKAPVIPGDHIGATIAGLIAGFSDFTFNTEKNPWVKGEDGEFKLCRSHRRLESPALTMLPALLSLLLFSLLSSLFSLLLFQGAGLASCSLPAPTMALSTSALLAWTCPLSRPPASVVCWGLR